MEMIRICSPQMAQRLAMAPDVPTIAESGSPGFEVIGWAAVFAPAGTPADAVTRLNHALNNTLAQPDVKERLLVAGIETRPGTPDDLDRFVRAEFDKWGKVIRTAPRGVGGPRSNAYGDHRCISSTGRLNSCVACPVRLPTSSWSRCGSS